MTTDWDVGALMEVMARDLRPLIDPEQAAMIGIFTGGVWLARALHAALGLQQPLGRVDISFYRDDFSQIGLHPQVRASDIPFAVDGRDIILVDDVLYTGRTVRAAMNEIFDYGRPARILLAVLVDRGGHELPVAADVAALRLIATAGEHIKLRGPDPLRLELEQREPQP
ncbi:MULTISPECIES: bifunctional pyr operon transcriptional regulator/uracil phosphoribosyltransferase PyrR [Acidithiobacillus]|jgi:pyrimidine operon attenuation protein/uracil phosphoribosyltransferase|uniref:Bifunctional pyr operon transcriptional regulator/uracil phosphoribosyltransferase PyrR n=2 Tax=Acidithiobacillus ferridurans TaxID=1232575 RepID=A0A8X8GAK8_ACIFI|nr:MULTISPECIES: bifunctional pyr operon transcriptional regulator/uracil phosphoribosyltransferase PyrR [Acidithiobacillus]MBU2716113.1 bifunctional pyr operon transcriptional regulator/uracil phosphoribosyltransferase PyrR [Acidithiobacillus ferridurans]MBU2723237.1 bifunctional pyr operon transcriptional regulator/uracil phosphoribosyltransferase PyrR [Acidithiobacillus ferridurans]MBU2725228.1 bifunctional pyr operon transcriptional regulator/uracil phosphoribosyltransferase PyrR [Acidithiob